MDIDIFKNILNCSIGIQIGVVAIILIIVALLIFSKMDSSSEEDFGESVLNFLILKKYPLIVKIIIFVLFITLVSIFLYCENKSKRVEIINVNRVYKDNNDKNFLLQIKVKNFTQSRVDLTKIKLRFCKDECRKSGLQSSSGMEKIKYSISFVDDDNKTYIKMPDGLIQKSSIKYPYENDKTNAVIYFNIDGVIKKEDSVILQILMDTQNFSLENHNILKIFINYDDNKKTNDYIHKIIGVKKGDNQL